MIVIIPTLNPDHHLLSVVNALKNVVSIVCRGDDGSGTVAALAVDVATYPKSFSLKHSVNLGKGRALKTAFNHCLNCWINEKISSA